MSERPETRHLPVADAETEPYWRAAAAGKLWLRSCTPCGQVFHYPRARCPGCWSSEVAWQEASGGGTVYSFTVVRQNGARPFRDRIPYVVALVDLDEGPRLLATIDRADPDTVAIGRRVRVAFRQESEEIVLPVFALEAS